MGLAGAFGLAGALGLLGALGITGVFIGGVFFEPSPGGGFLGVSVLGFILGFTAVAVPPPPPEPFGVFGVSGFDPPPVELDGGLGF